ncbi:MAG: Hsp70 family protein [Prolixibacteraceae bacterium]|nr:Hsp70 family protein [Prolixibacteraceae bacterium]
MNYCVLVKISKQKASFWYQSEGSSYAPLIINESNEVPLYFYVFGNVYIFGNSAREKYFSNDPNAFGNYFENIKDPSKHFIISGISKPFKQLLYYGIEQYLSHFINTILYKSDSIESFRNDFPLRFLFESDIEDKEKALIERIFTEAGYDNIARIDFNQALFEVLCVKGILTKNKSILMLNGIDDTLYLELYENLNGLRIGYSKLEGQGADPRVKILAELIVEDVLAINSYLSINKEAEIASLLSYSSELLANNTPIIKGNVTLTDGKVYNFEVKRRNIDDRLMFVPNESIINHEINAILDTNGIRVENVTIILGSSQINTSYLLRKLRSIYSDVIGVEIEHFNDSMKLIFSKIIQSHKLPLKIIIKQTVQDPTSKPENISPLTNYERDPNRLLIGIDLGTTFSCVAYTNNGVPQVVPDNRGREITPSVIWYDGKTCYVGEAANNKKITALDPIFEFFKLDMGRPIEGVVGKPIKAAPYNISGIKFGAIGLSAILLRKLKRDAWQYFKKNKIIEESIKEIDFIIDAIITVPANFGDDQKKATIYAGELAGLNVVNIINEPTAASLTYGISLSENKKFLVFDLGGGTLDVTILEIVDGGLFKVIASDGIGNLGGKNWDNVIIDYLKEKFKIETGTEIPEEQIFDLQKSAIQAKKELSVAEETVVYISANGFDIDIKLFRSAPINRDNSDLNKPFYFDERCEKLLEKCISKCNDVLNMCKMSWQDLDEIVLAGGSCRMPMIPEMLEKLSNKKIKTHRDSFNYDTAIAFGAAIYGQKKEHVEDVVSKSIGIKLENNQGLKYIDHLIYKNSVLPARAQKRYKTDPFANLEIYEGESKELIGCDKLGKLELENTGEYATIILEINKNGVLRVLADYQPEGIKETNIKGSSDFPDYLKDIIQNITILS